MTIHLRAAGGAGLRRAMTLVEMLIAMALTLILVYAIAEFYAYIGPSVKDGRAMIDLVAQLRTATTRLRADLELLTVPVRVFTDDGVSHGYFEYREGQASDFDSDGDLRLDVTQDAFPADGVSDFAAGNWSTMAGDCDDYLAGTIRSETVPFTGQIVQVGANGVPLTGPTGGFATTTGSSTTAEVAWWTSFTDLNGNQFWTPNEPRFLQRRQLLVASELNQAHPADQTPGRPGSYYLRVQTGVPAQATYELMQQSDVSVRPILHQNNSYVLNGFVYFAANTLLDLTRRENRFMHIHPSFTQPFQNRPQFLQFPHGLDLDANFDGDRTLVRWDEANNFSQWRWVLGGTRLGEDRLLPNVLSFDIRVFDPTAPIRADNADTVYTNSSTTDDAAGTVQPGDMGGGLPPTAPPQGWDAAVAYGFPLVGQGAYVDLFYNRHVVTPVNSHFSAAPGYIGPPSPPAPATLQSNYMQALGATYDTWALSYERDGIDQLGDGRIDLGTNGFDDPDIITGNAINGVDDPRERETTPPYAVPLRGIQVRLRVYEPTTRQVRQASIGWDFISE